MDAFEAKIRGFHAKAVQNIMTRRATTQKFRKIVKNKGSVSCSQKPDNITTYLRKFEIDRQNLNLAQRIMLCDSEHNHKKYERQWKKNQNFARVRSNFKRNLCNQEPRQFKIQHISGFGSLLVTLRLIQIASNPVYFKPGNKYSLVIHTKKSQPIKPTNYIFDIESMSQTAMAFYLPRLLKKKNLCCKITQFKQNETLFKGKFYFKPSQIGTQEIQIVNKAGDKVIGVLFADISVENAEKEKKYGRKIINLSKHCTNYISNINQESLVNTSTMGRNHKSFNEN